MNKDQMEISINICIQLLEVEFNNYFVFPFNLFPGLDLVLAIIPSVGISACIQSGFSLNWKNNEYYFYIDIYGEAEASVSLDVGFYVPSHKSMVSTSVHIGIHGLIGSGKVGLKLSLFLTKDNFIVDLYSEIKAFEFSFYIVFKITINFEKLKFLKIFSIEGFTYEFNIFSHIFVCLFNYKYHLEKSYKYNSQLISSKSTSNLKLDFILWDKEINKVKYLNK